MRCTIFCAVVENENQIPHESYANATDIALWLPSTSLDLNGFTLSVNNVVGVDTTRVYDSSNNAQNNYDARGLLRVKGSMILSETNEKSVPVYLPEYGGYIFADFLFNSQVVQEKDVSTVNALVTSRTTEILDVLKDGANENNVQIVIRITANGGEPKDFAFSEVTIMNVMRSNKGAFNSFERMFYANFTGLEEFDSVTACIAVIANNNVVDVGSAFTLK